MPGYKQILAWKMLLMNEIKMPIGKMADIIRKLKQLLSQYTINTQLILVAAIIL